MELKEFTGKPCKSRQALEFIPKKRLNLKLEKIAEKIKKELFVEIETPYVLIMKVNGKSVSLFKSGKIIVKETTEEKEGRAIAEKVLGFMS